jgi:hypothetical protein
VATALGEPAAQLQLAASLRPVLSCYLSATPPSPAVFEAMWARTVASSTGDDGDAAAAAAAAAALAPDEVHALVALQEAIERSNAASAAAPLLSADGIAREAAAAAAIGADALPLAPDCMEALTRLCRLGVSVRAHAPRVPCDEARRSPPSARLREPR